MNAQRRLKKRFSDMFSGSHLGMDIDIDIAKGWIGLFTELCENIDSLLGENS